MNRWIALSGGLLLATLPGCVSNGEIDPNDDSPPVIDIMFRDGNGQYVSAPEADLGVMDSLDIMCVFKDPQGLKSSGVSCSGTSDSCTVASTVINGSYAIKTMPGPFQDTYPSSGALVTKAPVFIDLDGPFKCKIFGQVNGQSDGYPYGAEIKVTATAENWSSNNAAKSAKAVLVVKLH